MPSPQLLQRTAAVPCGAWSGFSRPMRPAMKQRGQGSGAPGLSAADSNFASKRATGASLAPAWTITCLAAMRSALSAMAPSMTNAQSHLPAAMLRRAFDVRKSVSQLCHMLVQCATLFCAYRAAG